MASVVESKGKTGTTWRVRTRDAEGRQTTETFRVKREAEEFARLVELVGGPAAIRNRIEREGSGVSTVPTLAEWLPQFTEQLSGVTERTRLDYHSRARLYWQELMPLPLDAIKREHVSKLVNALDRQGLAAGTIKTIVRALSAVLNGAILAEHIDRNPCKGVRLPKPTEGAHGEEVHRYLTPAEYLRLMAVLPERERPLVALLFGSGLRWSEATALAVGDVTIGDPKLGTLSTVRVSKAWKTTPGKPRRLGAPKSVKSRRLALLSDDAVRLVKPLLDREPGARLFVGKQGGPIYPGTWRARVWVPACMAAGLASPRVEGKPWAYDGPRVHDARHSHASWLLSYGATLEMLQDQMGHESILTTRAVYGHLLPESRNRLADALRAAMASGIASTSAGELAPGGDR